jgi:hypothetical protein
LIVGLPLKWIGWLVWPKNGGKAPKFVLETVPGDARRAIGIAGL